MINPGLTDVINAASFLAFFALLVVGGSSVLARWAYYRAHGYRMPRLLGRDAILLVGFMLSFGLILVARLLPDAVRRDVLTDNVLWSLATALPAIVAVAVFVYFELFVIERGDDVKRELRDLRGRTALDAILEAEDDETLPPRVPKV